MQATEIMTRDVIAVQPDTEVKSIVELMLQHRISAVPVVDDTHQVLGMVSEGDLMRRVENKTERRDSWWLKALFTASNDAAAYVESHGAKAADIMTRDVHTISEDTPLYKIAQTLEEKRIKRVPVVRDGKLVGIVSRSNLLQGFSVAHTAEGMAGTADDKTIRERILKELKDKAGISRVSINVVVHNGHVTLWGLVQDASEKKAVGVAAESIAGMGNVTNHLGIAPPVIGPY